jgi:hypothetical protein
MEGVSEKLSPLELLPDEVLMRLLQFLDPSGLQAMGQVCSDLKRLVIDHAFRQAVKWQRRRFLDESLILLSVVLRLDPFHAGALDERAITRFNVSDKAGAIRDLKRSVSVASNESERLMYQSVALEMQVLFSLFFVFVKKKQPLCFAFLCLFCSQNMLFSIVCHYFSIVCHIIVFECLLCFTNISMIS